MTGSPRLGYDLGSATSLGLLAWSAPHASTNGAHMALATIGGQRSTEGDGLARLDGLSCAQRAERRVPVLRVLCRHERCRERREERAVPLGTAQGDGGALGRVLVSTWTSLLPAAANVCHRPATALVQKSRR